MTTTGPSDGPPLQEAIETAPSESSATSENGDALRELMMTRVFSLNPPARTDHLGLDTAPLIDGAQPFIRSRRLRTMDRLAAVGRYLKHPRLRYMQAPCAALC